MSLNLNFLSKEGMKEEVLGMTYFPLYSSYSHVPWLLFASLKLFAVELHHA